MKDITSCPGKPEDLKGQPIGMYHCDYCGAMVIAGLPHPTDEQVKEAGDIPYCELPSKICHFNTCVWSGKNREVGYCEWAVIDEHGEPDCGYG